MVVVIMHKIRSYFHCSHFPENFEHVSMKYVLILGHFKPHFILIYLRTLKLISHWFC